MAESSALPKLIDPISRREKLHTGLTYHWLEWGAADAPIVVLLHGFLDFAWTWEAVVNSGHLSRYRVIAPDLRGYGDTSHVGPGAYYYFMDYLADVDAIVEKVRGEKKQVAIVGHSMGGSVAAYYSGTYPDRVSKLVMLEGLGPPDQSDDKMPDRVRTWIAAWRRVTAQASRPMRDLDEAAERLRRHDTRLDPQLARRLAERGTVELADGKRVFKHDPLHVTPGPYPFSLTIAGSFWSRVSCPVLLVSAGESEFQYTDEEFARRKNHFANARVEILPSCGHMMQRHQPAALGKLLADFIG